MERFLTVIRGRQGKGWRNRPFRDDIHDPSHGIGAVQDGGRSLDHLNVFDFFRGDGLQVEGVEKRFVNRNPVKEKDDPLAFESADFEVEFVFGANRDKSPGGKRQDIRQVAGFEGFDLILQDDGRCREWDIFGTLCLDDDLLRDLFLFFAFFPLFILGSKIARQINRKHDK